MPRRAPAGTPDPSLIGLRAIRLFDGLPEAVVAEVAARCTWRHCRRGEYVISREMPDRDVLFIVAGRVQVQAFSSAGRQVTYRDIEAGGWVGDLAAIDGRPRSADIKALTDALVAALSPDDFLDLLARHPEINRRLLLRLAGFVRDLSDRVFDLSTLGVANRVHAEVLRLAREAGVADNQACIAPMPTHTEIASRVSTYREQVTRELSALQRLGLLRRESNRVIVTDVERLERMVREVRGKV